MKIANAVPEKSAAAQTLTKAVVRAADLLQINKQSLAKIIGVSPSTVTRMTSGQYRIEPRSNKEWELAVLFVRTFRSLDAIFGHADTARQWLTGDNLALQGKPADMLQTAEGLIRVLHYLDAHRGKI